MPLPDKETHERLKREHGYVAVLGSDAIEGHAFLMRRPRRPEYERYREELANENRAALETLFRAIMLWPTPSDLDAIVEEFPAVFEELQHDVRKLAGYGGKTYLRKI